MEALRKALQELAVVRGVDLAARAELARGLPPRDDGLTDGEKFRVRRNEALFDMPGRLPQKFRHAALSADTADPRIDRWLSMHIDDPVAHSHLLLSGTIGSGKTWHMIALLKDMVQGAAESGRSPSWRYVSHSALARKMRDFKDDNARRTLDELIETKILAFDDLGTALNREYSLEWLIELVDARSAAGGELVTLYATNVRIADLGRVTENGPALDGRIASRLLEGENVIIMDGADRRRATMGVIR